MNRPVSLPGWLAVAAVMVLPLACRRSEPPVRQFELRGQVLAVRPETNEIVIRHDDIKDFMPAMTMPFKVRDARLLEGRARGDLVAGTLIVTDDESYLSALRKVGFAEVVAAPAPAPAAPLVGIGDMVPDVALVDGSGRPFSLASLRGRAAAMTFVYTSCPLPDFCPLMDSRFRAVQERVKADGVLAGQVRLVSVSFDPITDTPRVLRAHAREVGADPQVWTYVTGDQQAIDRLTAALGVVAVRDAAVAGGFTHNLRTLVLDREGRLAAAFNGNDWRRDDLVAALRQALLVRTQR